MEASATFKSPPGKRITSLKHLDQYFSQNNLTISPIYTQSGRDPHVKVTQGFPKSAKRGKGKLKAKTTLSFPEVEESELRMPSMQYRAKISALEKFTEAKINVTPGFIVQLEQIDEKHKKMEEEKAEAKQRKSDRLHGTKRPLIQLADKFNKKQRRQLDALEAQADAEEEDGLDKFLTSVNEFVADLNPELADLVREKALADKKDGVNLPRIKNWAKRQLQRAAKRAKESSVQCIRSV